MYKIMIWQYNEIIYTFPFCKIRFDEVKYFINTIFTQKMSSIIIYDGTCSFCSHFINKVSVSDDNYFSFCNASSSKYPELINKIPAEYRILDSVYLIENGEVYVQSKAIHKIVQKCKGKFNAINFVLTVFPYRFSNIFYVIFAKNRHRFMKNRSCNLPSSSLLNRHIA
jgi:predicted DCC family thiol-disulfide oxidoreductase YuxK